MGTHKNSSSIAFLLRIKGVRLWVLMATVTIVAAVGIVSAMSWLIKGEVTWDYVLTGLVTAVIVAPVSLSLLTQLLNELAASNEARLAHQLTETRSRLNGALDESRKVLQTIVDTVPMRVFWKDHNSRYLGCNPAFARDAGKSSPQELVGLDDFRMGWMEQAELYRADDRAVMESGRAKLAYEEPQTTPDGRQIWLRTSKVPLRNPQGAVIGVLGVYEDITEYKQAEAELDRHRHHLEELVAQRTDELGRTEARASHILRSSADGLYGVGRDGRVTFINPAACALLGYPAEAVIGRSAHELFHHSRPDGTPYPVGECPSHGALSTGNAVRVDSEVYWHADGSAVPVMYAVHPMANAGKVDGAVVSFVDMSEQRAAAAAREEALVAAENLARVRREFLANMSHEIRTPLNGVLGFAQIGYRHYQDADKVRNAFEKIIASGNLLLGVINEVLDFSKIEAGKLTVEQVVVNLDQLIEHSIDLIRERAQGKRLELVVERMPNLPQACMGDGLRMGQVLLNLLSNAVKFTESGTIALAIALRGSRLVFRVWDTGIGMTQQQINQLFNPFQQADGSTTRRYGGTGLGLAISKRLAELMGGDIRVQSEVGKGSTFEFYLPFIPASAADLQAEAAAELPPHARSDQPLAGLHLLVAEDNPLNQAMLRDTLIEAGAAVTVADDGRVAVDLVRKAGPGAFALVLMDVQMPELNGYEATQQIHAFAPDLPIVGQTAHAFGEDRAKCLAAGMLAHIPKPIDPDELVQQVLLYARRSATG
ncbi:MAG: ATP-binding protein [Pseudomonadota bacterium]